MENTTLDKLNEKLSDMAIILTDILIAIQAAKTLNYGQVDFSATKIIKDICDTKKTPNDTNIVYLQSTKQPVATVHAELSKMKLTKYLKTLPKGFHSVKNGPIRVLMKLYEQTKGIDNFIGTLRVLKKRVGLINNGTVHRNIKLLRDKNYIVFQKKPLVNCTYKSLLPTWEMKIGMTEKGIKIAKQIKECI